ncbi:MAG: PAS domain-containing protein [Candidatus Hydrogenedens sp.]|nr:PAS domain-containing protein [Candidatus Hydrogenedens sp.]
MSESIRSQLRAFYAALRPQYDGPATWLWFVGIARIGLLLILIAGILLLVEALEYGYVLGGIYLGSFASGLWYFIVLRREGGVSPTLTWTQMVVDFGVVVATISFTRGEESFFTFLLVVVILEAGVLLGLIQGFVFATFASMFMFFQFAASAHLAADPLAHWYNFLIQAIAFFFTAFISGYWNQRLSRMKQFQRDILDNMNSGFLISDPKGVIIAINKAACDILGLVERDIVGRHVDGVLAPATGAECPVTTALRSDTDFSSYEFYCECGTGASILLGLTTNRIRNTQGRLTGLIATFIDLTEMARMRQELQQQDRMAVIGELSAGLAHEIRNPVASIRGAMEELLRHPDKPGMNERLAKIAVRESDHLNKIVTGFLDFARRPSRERQAVDLCEVINDVLANLQRKYDRAAGLRISIQKPKDPCVVSCDPTQIRQVFLNLGQNAVEAMQEEGYLEIQLVETRGPYEIRFNDTGPGVPPDKVARIFEPFYTDKERGVGMGLAVCLRIVNSHDGTIQVGSRPEGGASIVVRLPRASSRE